MNSVAGPLILGQPYAGSSEIFQNSTPFLTTPGASTQANQGPSFLEFRRHVVLSLVFNFAPLVEGAGVPPSFEHLKSFVLEGKDLASALKRLSPKDREEVRKAVGSYWDELCSFEYANHPGEFWKQVWRLGDRFSKSGKTLKSAMGTYQIIHQAHALKGGLIREDYLPNSYVSSKAEKGLDVLLGDGPGWDRFEYELGRASEEILDPKILGPILFASVLGRWVQVKVVERLARSRALTGGTFVGANYRSAAVLGHISGWLTEGTTFGSGVHYATALSGESGRSLSHDVLGGLITLGVLRVGGGLGTYGAKGILEGPLQGQWGDLGLRGMVKVGVPLGTQYVGLVGAGDLEYGLGLRADRPGRNKWVEGGFTLAKLGVGISLGRKALPGLAEAELNLQGRLRASQASYTLPSDFFKTPQQFLRFVDGARSLFNAAGPRFAHALAGQGALSRHAEFQAPFRSQMLALGPPSLFDFSKPPLEPTPKSIAALLKIPQKELIRVSTVMREIEQQTKSSRDGLLALDDLFRQHRSPFLREIREMLTRWISYVHYKIQGSRPYLIEKSTAESFQNRFESFDFRGRRYNLFDLWPQGMELMARLADDFVQSSLFDEIKPEREIDLSSHTFPFSVDESAAWPRLVVKPNFRGGIHAFGKRKAAVAHEGDLGALAIATHDGNRGGVNEDGYLFFEHQGSWYVLLFDGLGGHGKGDMATKVAVQTVRQSVKKGGKSLYDALMEAHLEILKKVQPTARGMRYIYPGTTAVGYQLKSLADGSFEGTFVTTGDSRLYHFRKFLLGTWRTWAMPDHSHVRVHEPHLSHLESRAHPDAHYVIEHLGSDPNRGNPRIIVVRRRVLPGDVLELSTDGVDDNVGMGERVLHLEQAEASGHLSPERLAFDNFGLALDRMALLREAWRTFYPLAQKELDEAAMTSPRTVAQSGWPEQEIVYDNTTGDYSVYDFYGNRQVSGLRFPLGGSGLLMDERRSIYRLSPTTGQPELIGVLKKDNATESALVVRGTLVAPTTP